ncbi:penicillin-binding protein activator LpoB [Gammaproteobacteria bacterium AB-CW1]|uniref:Penicillin-binding protein activator LpoB n=1 Tax=Natronospira elongata TaxID=3110268 RepID=A0AAP6JEZ5_9GAMM|nr:penicillin-binding protein activator LpoB [Gammaproteobacteria bacterium AB-CW1]
MKVFARWILLALVAVAVSGCGGTQVERVGADEQVDLTDRWNITDSRNVASVMIDDMLTFPWLERFRADNPDRDRPRVIIQSVRNRSHEHIPVDTFINELRREMIRSGRVDFVAGGAERDEIRDERRDQEFHADPETAARMGRELGADYALVGSIDSTIDRLDGTRVTSYQVDLRLVDVETNVDVWHGQHQEQKVMRRARRGL